MKSRPDSLLVSNMKRLVCLLVISSLLPLAHATITVGDKHFSSMPAVFGKPFSLVERDDIARLQVLRDDTFLCQVNNETEDYVIPPDGLPVAVLVSRGECSFEEKARTAMDYGFISYVIVHDDRPRAALVPMSATDPDNVTVGMLFVSHTSGMLLRRMILEQSENITKAGGLLIQMDARSPPMPPTYDQTQQWMLAAMGGFFTFMACFGCLLIGIHAGYIPADGARIVITQNGIHATAASSRGRRRFLTESQVRRLPHETYVKGEDDDADHHASGCAICIEEYHDGEVLKVLPCSHKFHTDCIVPWLTERQASCPLCKLEITEDDLLEEDEDEESSGSRRWFWSSWGRSDRIIVPTEDQDAFETPPGSPSRILQGNSPPLSPLSPSRDTVVDEDTEAMIPPGEAS